VQPQITDALVAAVRTSALGAKAGRASAKGGLFYTPCCLARQSSALGDDDPDGLTDTVHLQAHVAGD
jgi:hypothetical protein